VTVAAAIETLGRADAADLLALSGAVGWNHTSDDWRTILDAGRIFGHRATGGGLASSGALFDFGPALASIGMILVAPPHRRQGLARGMMQHCLAAAGHRPVTLIATAQGEPLYRALGFAEVGRVCRMVADVAPSGERVPQASAVDLDDIARLDREAFGADRRRLLDALLRRSTATAVVRDVRGGVRAFGIAIQQPTQLVVRPLIAPTDDDARCRGGLTSSTRSRISDCGASTTPRSCCSADPRCPATVRASTRSPVEDSARSSPPWA
jgi:predicted N-acetyltransferase YhbS